MDKNVGDADGSIRILVGAVSGALSIGILLGLVQLDTLFSPVLGLVAIVMLATGLTRKCPLLKRFVEDRI